MNSRKHKQQENQEQKEKTNKLLEPLTEYQKTEELIVNKS